MNRSGSPRLSAVLAAFVVTSSATAVLVGGVTLLGWWTGTYGLTRFFFGGGPTMNPMTAVAATLCAIALALLRRPETPWQTRTFARLAAACATTIGMARLAGYLLVLPTDVDELLFSGRLSAVAFGPSRMAFATALGITLIGAALLLLDVETPARRRPAQLLAAAASTIGLFGVTSYVFLGGPFRFGESATVMAPNTALVLMVLSLGVLCARPMSGRMGALTRAQPGAALVRRVLLPAVGFAWLFCWLGLLGARAQLYPIEVGFAVAAVLIVAIAVVIGCRAGDAYDRLDAARRRAVRDLDRREVQVRSILDHSEALIFVKDTAGRYRFANRALGRLLGIPAEAFHGRTDYDFFPTDKADEYRANDRRIMEEGEARQVEESALIGDRDRTYLVVKFPLRDDDGRPTALCGIATDISDRKRSEQAAARLRDRIATMNRVLGVLASSDDTHWYADVLDVVCAAFDSGSGVFAHGDDASAAPDASPARLARWTRLLAEHGAVREEATGPDGMAHRSLGIAIRDRGTLLGVLEVADRDLAYDDDDVGRLEEIAAVIAAALAPRLERTRVEARRRQTEEELRQIARRLQSANEGLESFSYSISHDLRAPLRAIGGFAKILSTEHAATLDAEGQRLLGVVCDNTRKMTRLVDDLLRFARVDRREVVCGRVDMDALVAAVVAETRSAHHENVVSVRIGTLPAVWGDGNLLRQVVANLVDNAWKFTRGRPDPTIDISGRYENDERVYVVRDNGAGFDMRYVQRLFGVPHPVAAWA